MQITQIAYLAAQHPWAALVIIAAAIVLSMGAFGDNSAFKGAPDAYQFNKMSASESYMLWRDASMLVNMGTGAKVGQDEDEYPTFDKDTYVKGIGRKIEGQFSAGPRTMTSVPVANQGDDDVINAAKTRASQEFQIAHYEDKIPIEKDKLVLYADSGPEMKLNYLDEMFRDAEESRIRTLELALNNNDGTDAGTAPTDGLVGSWLRAIDDGGAVAANNGIANYKNYGTIDRSVAGNEMFRPARLNGNLGNLTLNEIGIGQLSIQNNRGRADAAWAGVNVLQRVRTILEGFCEAVVSGRYIDFGGDKFRYGTTTFGLEGQCPAGFLGMCDSRYVKFYLKKAPLTREGVVYMPTKKALYVLPYDLWGQIIFWRVNTAAKWGGINA